MKDAIAAEIADAFLTHFITPFGLPNKLLTERGSNFLSRGIMSFLKAGIHHFLQRQMQFLLENRSSTHGLRNLTVLQ